MSQPKWEGQEFYAFGQPARKTAEPEYRHTVKPEILDPEFHAESEFRCCCAVIFQVKGFQVLPEIAFGFPFFFRHC